MESKTEKIVELLVKDGYPRELIERYIKACKKNYERDEQIISDLERWIIPLDMKNNKKYFSERIYLLKNRTYFQEAIDVYPRLDIVENLE